VNCGFTSPGYTKSEGMRKGNDEEGKCVFKTHEP